MSFQIEHKQVETQDNSYAQCHNIPVAFVDRKCVTPMTFSQKLYQAHELEIAEEFEQAIEATSLEKTKKLLDKVLETYC